jgi:hypothetical protein
MIYAPFVEKWVVFGCKIAEIGWFLGAISAKMRMG